MTTKSEKIHILQQPKDTGSLGRKMINGPEHESDDKNRDLFSTSDLTRDLNQKAVRGGAAVMGAELGSSILRIGSIAVLARLLLPEDFGLLAMVTALTVFAERFKDFGLADATVQTRDINHQQASSLFWINLSICICIALVLACLSKAIAWFYNDLRLTAISLVLASTFLFSGLVIQHQALLRRQLRFGTLAFIQLFSTVLSIIVAIVLAYYGFEYWALVAREFSRAVFVVVGTWFACPWRPGPPRRGTALRHFLSFAKYLTLFNLVYFFSRSIDKILIGRLFGPSSAGLYVNAQQMIALPANQIVYPVNTVALPALSALQAESSAFRAYHEKMLRLLSFFSMPIMVFLGVFADLIIDLVLGPQWKKAVPIFQVLAIGAFVEPIVATVGPAMVASGKTREYFRLGLVNVLSLLCCLGIGSFWGAIGVALGSSVKSYLALLACLIYGLKQTPIRTSRFLGGIAPAFFCSLSTGFALLAIRLGVGWLVLPQSLFLFALTGVLTYLGSWLLVPGGREMLIKYLGYVPNFIYRIKR